MSAAVFAALITIGNSSASAQEPYIGELMIVGNNFCPRGWANTDGQLLPINQNQALFAVLGTMYGGDGRTTLGLPELRGRAAVGVGSGAGIPATTVQGQKLGTTSINLTQATMPGHSHAVRAAGAAATNSNPQGDLLAGALLYRSGNPSIVMSNLMITNKGDGLSVNKRSPTQVVRYCIAIQGLFPSRN